MFTVPRVATATITACALLAPGAAHAQAAPVGSVARAAAHASTVAAKPRVTVTVSTREPIVDEAFKIRGVASGFPVGARVQLQQRVEGKWYTITSTSARKGGAYAFSFTLEQPTKAQFRVSVRSGKKTAISSSVTVTGWEWRKLTDMRSVVHEGEKTWTLPMTIDGESWDWAWSTLVLGDEYAVEGFVFDGSCKRFLAHAGVVKEGPALLIVGANKKQYKYEVSRGHSRYVDLDVRGADGIVLGAFAVGQYSDPAFGSPMVLCTN